MSGGAGSVAVIGAGAAGLAAAWRLSGSGHRVRVYEARPVAGGRMRTETVAGAAADVAVQLLSDGYDRTRGLLEEMGLADRLAAVPGRDAVWRDGRAHGLRYGSAASMAASGALPAMLKLRLGLRYLPFLERHAGSLDLNAPVLAAAAGLDGESIAEWGRREVGDDFVELLVYPLLAAYYGVTPEETSAALFHALARAGLGVSVMGVRGGVGGLAEAMAGALAARGVELRYGAAVTAVAEASAGVDVDAGNAAERHAAAVIAVPPRAAAGLVPDASWLAGLRTRSTATLVLAVDGVVDTGWFGLSIPRGEPPGDVIAAVCVQSAKGTGLGGAGDTVVVVPTPAAGATWVTADADTVLASALPAVRRVLPGLGPRVRESRLVRMRDQVFVPEPGHFDRLRAEDRAAVSERVVLAGDYLVSPTVEGAVRSGLEAARRISRAGA